LLPRSRDRRDLDAGRGTDFLAPSRSTPVCAYQDATHDFAPRKLSDFLTRNELHRREIYADFFRPLGVEFELDVGLPAPLTHTKVFLFTRGERDFTERERLLLDLLRPYLRLLYTAARDQRVLAALESHDESARQLVVLDRAGSPDFVGPEARELLDRYFAHDSRRELPEAVEAWLRTSSPVRPLTSQCDGRRLVVRRVGDVLVVQEELARLTRREREIVALVAEGRSNAEIAARLWLSPGTVRIHLQHVYEKLGVRSRTAAVARVRQIEGESTYDRTAAEAD
jgi:DNA-binding CsgD family transcriptional regulator